MVDVELVEVMDRGKIQLPVSDVGNMAIMHQNVMQPVKKYNNIVQANHKQQNTIQANNYCIQVSYRMTPTMTSQPVGFSIKLMLCTTRLILRLNMGDVFQWNGCYWTTNPPLMCSLIISSSEISGGLANICTSIAQPGSPEPTW